MRAHRLPALSVSVFAAGLVLGGTTGLGLAADDAPAAPPRLVPVSSTDWGPGPQGTLQPWGAAPADPAWR